MNYLISITLFLTVYIVKYAYENEIAYAHNCSTVNIDYSSDSVVKNSVFNTVVKYQTIREITMINKKMTKEQEKKFDAMIEAENAEKLRVKAESKVSASKERILVALKKCSADFKVISVSQNVLVIDTETMKESKKSGLTKNRSKDSTTNNDTKQRFDANDLCSIKEIDSRKIIVDKVATRTIAFQTLKANNAVFNARYDKSSLSKLCFNEYLIYINHDRNSYELRKEFYDLTTDKKIDKAEYNSRAK